MKCSICETEGKKIFEGVILKKYKIDYFQCPICGLVYTEKPYWLNEAYADAIVKYDTGIMQRNLSFVVETTAVIEYIFGKKNIRGLDWGGGYGIFTRFMRDTGYDYYWSDKYSQCLVARGFEAVLKDDEKYDIITAFELFEHFENIMDEVSKMMQYTDTILFSTLTYGNDFRYPQIDEWWYYALEGGQHISFYSEITLQKIADQLNVKVYSINNSLHIFTKKKLNVKVLKFYLNTLVGKSIINYKWRHLQNGQGPIRDMNLLINMK